MVGTGQTRTLRQGLAEATRPGEVVAAGQAHAGEGHHREPIKSKP